MTCKFLQLHETTNSSVQSRAIWFLMCQQCFAFSSKRPNQEITNQTVSWGDNRREVWWWREQHTWDLVEVQRPDVAKNSRPSGQQIKTIYMPTDCSGDFTSPEIPWLKTGWCHNHELDPQVTQEMWSFRLQTKLHNNSVGNESLRAFQDKRPEQMFNAVSTLCSWFSAGRQKALNWRLHQVSGLLSHLFPRLLTDFFTALWLVTKMERTWLSGVTKKTHRSGSAFRPSTARHQRSCKCCWTQIPCFWGGFWQSCQLTDVESTSRSQTRRGPQITHNLWAETTVCREAVPLLILTPYVALVGYIYHKCCINTAATTASARQIPSKTRFPQMLNCCSRTDAWDVHILHETSTNCWTPAVFSKRPTDKEILCHESFVTGGKKKTKKTSTTFIPVVSLLAVWTLPNKRCPLQMLWTTWSTCQTTSLTSDTCPRHGNVNVANWSMTADIHIWIAISIQHPSIGNAKGVTNCVDTSNEVLWSERLFQPFCPVTSFLFLTKTCKAQSTSPRENNAYGWAK